MKRPRNGRMPSMVTIEAFSRLTDKPSSQLAAMRADLGSMMHVHGAMVNKLRCESEAITTILHAREKPEFEVSDHAVVRWLEKVKGQNMECVAKRDCWGRRCGQTKR